MGTIVLTSWDPWGQHAPDHQTLTPPAAPASSWLDPPSTRELMLGTLLHLGLPVIGSVIFVITEKKEQMREDMGEGVGRVTGR